MKVDIPTTKPTSHKTTKDNEYGGFSKTTSQKTTKDSEYGGFSKPKDEGDFGGGFDHGFDKFDYREKSQTTVYKPLKNLINLI